MAAFLTGGSYKFTKRVKDPSRDPNEYNAPFKEATAELTFAASEGEDSDVVYDLAQRVSLEVVHHVAAMLTGQAPALVLTSKPTWLAPTNLSGQSRP